MNLIPLFQHFFTLSVVNGFVHYAISHPTDEERLELREEAKEMFYHAYNAYMDNAYPADELMPLSCKGRYRDKEPSRGDVDDSLGNFSLTLVDSLDTLVILGDLEEFERAVKLIIKDVQFDSDLIVSVFETNIRMVGGLLSGHVLSEHLNQLYGTMPWYRGELLSMARDLANRLLPAFNTTTGVPYPRVNLRYGMRSPKLQNTKDTCTSCAGTIILEFACLSRLTGEPIYEEKARQAMDYLWGQRHRGSDLVGTVLNIHSGDWVRRDSGVGAGIDSYYEYLLKAYVLLGDESYLDRFNKHYNAVMKYISQGPMLLDVHMHRPHTTARNFMDALLAFWPGLQVLKGDIKPAIETHEMLYQVIQRHNFLPEAFTTDFQVHWGQHPLRPEFVESTYLLYQATGDPYYLKVGEQVLRSLQKHAWVPCGYASVKDVRTGGHEDSLDSYVLAETFKYLYLLFTVPSELPINLEEFIFTTEAHILPLSLARLSNLTAVPLRENQDIPVDDDVEYSRSCPNAHYLFPGRHQFAETIRKPLKNFVNNVCPSRKAVKRKLKAAEFQAGSSSHMNILKNMGITIMALSDGRVQLLHTASNAKTQDDAEEGLLFMQEMIELSKLQQEQPENPPRSVSFHKGDKKTLVTLRAGPAQFGLELKGFNMVTGAVVQADPLKACTDLTNPEAVLGKIVIVERGDCMFVEKARRIEKLGAIGGIVIDNDPNSSTSSSPMFAMSGDGNDNVSIPLVFLFKVDADVLLKELEIDPDLEIYLSDNKENSASADKDKKSTNKEDKIEVSRPKVGSGSFDYKLKAFEDEILGEDECSNNDIITLGSSSLESTVESTLESTLDQAKISMEKHSEFEEMISYMNEVIVDLIDSINTSVLFPTSASKLEKEINNKLKQMNNLPVMNREIFIALVSSEISTIVSSLEHKEIDHVKKNLPSWVELTIRNAEKSCQITSIKEALLALDNAPSANEMIRAAASFVLSSKNHIQEGKQVHAPTGTYIANELKSLIVKKTTEDHNLLESLKIAHFHSLLVIFVQASELGLDSSDSVGHLFDKLMVLYDKKAIELRDSENVNKNQISSKISQYEDTVKLLKKLKQKIN